MKNKALIEKYFSAWHVEEEVAKLKQQDGKDIIIMNSSSNAQTLTNAGLVDEYRINVHPIIVNGRKGAFENIKDLENLELVNVKTYKTGVLGLHYKNKSR